MVPNNLPHLVGLEMNVCINFKVRSSQLEFLHYWASSKFNQTKIKKKNLMQTKKQTFKTKKKIQTKKQIFKTKKKMHLINLFYFRP